MPEVIRTSRYRRGPHAAAAIALLCASASAFAQSAQYTLDPVHTRVMFSLSHDGYSQAIGTVSGSTGTLVFDPDDWSRARLQATIPIDRIDLGDEKWNHAARADNLLDAEAHPTASFVSTRVDAIDPTHAVVHGKLTLRGVEQPIALQVTLNQVKRYPLPPFRRTAGFSATTTLSRKAFGIDAWSRLIGDQVTLRIEAEATHERSDDDAFAAPQGEDAATGSSTPEKSSPEKSSPDVSTPDKTTLNNTTSDTSTPAPAGDSTP